MVLGGTVTAPYTSGPALYCIFCTVNTVIGLWSCDLDWIEQGLTSHSTHFRSFRRRCGDCGISQDCSRSQSPQCVRCCVVCARPLLITVVCMCIIWKALCPYALGAPLGLWVSLEHTFTCASTINQAERRLSATHLLATERRALICGGIYARVYCIL